VAYPRTLENPHPITVNGVEIPDAAIHAEMQHHPAPSREIAEYSATLALVAQELLLQEAARLDIAESAIAHLDDQGGNFAELAAQWSDCPSKQAGGNLGQIGLAQTVPEFEQALFAMREGETSRRPVESRFGFHVIQLHRKTEGRLLEYDGVRDRIASYLCESVQRQAISHYLSLLTGRADIGGIDLLGADSPLAG
jgi:peptidyl-prolyl cis-trans isomerase C